MQGSCVKSPAPAGLSNKTVPPACTVYQNIRLHSAQRLDAAALEYCGGRIPYRNVFEQTERCARALRQAGVDAGECVAACASGVPEAVYLLLAANQIGAALHIVNPVQELRQIVRCIRASRARHLVVLDTMYAHVASAVCQTQLERVIVIRALDSLPPGRRLLAAWKNGPLSAIRRLPAWGEGHVPWTQFMQEGERFAGHTEAAYRGGAPVAVVYPAGGTGEAKGLALTNDEINAMIARYEDVPPEALRCEQFRPSVPLWLTMGVSLSILAPLCLGVTVTLEPPEQSIAARVARS